MRANLSGLQVELHIVSPKPFMSETTSKTHTQIYSHSCGRVKCKHGLLHLRSVSAVTAGVGEEA